ncbi:hypothetical protein BDV96DRAFT_592502 [Lophiotrema nucula]|uniref:Reverse transcriptase zinc-binding domain-containing protein n=1 Tax=Lophiotrema nucula TaxID=690887 RepID=A0A6A5YGG9_9PLEO|nr:hypothetical protein BDV96DRAFT_592502 [Lophiotrema nucula]
MSDDEYFEDDDDLDDEDFDDDEPFNMEDLRDGDYLPPGVRPCRGDGDNMESLLKGLEPRQNDFLRLAMGALQGTPIEELQKETNIEALDVFMRRICLTTRAKLVGTEVWDTIQEAKAKIERHGWTSPRSLRKRPGGEEYRPSFSQVDEMAKELRDLALSETHLSEPVPVRMRALLGNTIKKLAKRDTEDTMKARWSEYKTAKCKNLDERKVPHPAVLREGWGSKSINYYKGMKPPISTVLFQLRTECIQLKEYLADRGILPDGDTHCKFCPWRHETVDHLFNWCPKFEHQRRILKDRVGWSFNNLFTKHGYHAAEFAFQLFELESFDWSREHMMDEYKLNSF